MKIDFRICRVFANICLLINKNYTWHRFWRVHKTKRPLMALARAASTKPKELWALAINLDVDNYFLTHSHHLLCFPWAPPRATFWILVRKVPFRAVRFISLKCYSVLDNASNIALQDLHEPATCSKDSLLSSKQRTTCQQQFGFVVVR